MSSLRYEDEQDPGQDGDLTPIGGPAALPEPDLRRGTA
jgi:hypothetical protein